MKELHFLEVNNVSGGHLRLDENMTHLDVFSIRDDNKFKGGVLHTAPKAPIRKEKNFPLIQALRD